MRTTLEAVNSLPAALNVEHEASERGVPATTKPFQQERITENSM